MTGRDGVRRPRSLPACPPWCIADHGVDGAECVQMFGGESLLRHRTSGFVGVRGAWSIFQTDLLHTETGAVMGADEPPAIHLDDRRCGDSYTAAEARQLAAALMDAADRLDEIQGVDRPGVAHGRQSEGDAR